MPTRNFTADLVTGVISMMAGLAVIGASWGYTPQARHFPFWLGAVVAVCGVAIVLSALRAPRRAGESGEPAVFGDLRASGVGAALAYALVMLVWAVALSLGAGYLLPSIVALVLLLIITSERRPANIALGAISIALFCFTMFYIIFQTRLPEAQMIRDLFAPLRRLF